MIKTNDHFVLLLRSNFTAARNLVSAEQEWFNFPPSSSVCQYTVASLLGVVTAQ